MQDGSPKSILIVDDDPAALGALVEILCAEGYQVRWAASFPDAMRLLATESYDLLITEVRLGAYNGLQIAARIGLHHPATSAIVVTRLPDRALAEEARRLGAAYAVKPVSPAELLSLVARTLAAVDRRPATPGAD